MITARNVLRHELIGLEAEVLGCPNKSLVGTKGRIMMETKNTMTIGTKTVQKKGAVLLLKLGGKTVKVSGDSLMARPEERIKKKMKKW
ncbi:MAG: ribonuclease P protein subunit [Candidatus Aenigmatarchaeota archaeon]